MINDIWHVTPDPNKVYEENKMQLIKLGDCQSMNSNVRYNQWKYHYCHDHCSTEIAYIWRVQRKRMICGSNVNNK